MDERSTELERLYETTWQRVKETVNANDPEGLLAMGAPEDEYEDAVGELTRRVLRSVLNREPLDEGSLSSWFEDQYGQTAIVGPLFEQLTAIAADLERQGDR